MCPAFLSSFLMHPTLGRSRAAISEPKVPNCGDLRPRCPDRGAGYVPDMRRPNVNMVTSTIGLAVLVAAVAREFRMPHFFGIGWTPNLGRLARRLAQILRRSS